jgi:hypothetical protein
MPLLRCSSCRALIERARRVDHPVESVEPVEPVEIGRCANCGGVLMPSPPPVPLAVLEDEPTLPRVTPPRSRDEQRDSY